MNAPQFHFDGYTLRLTEERDRPLLTTWIAADPNHAGRVLPDFFLRNPPGEDCWALEDVAGHVVFYFKTQTAVRLHIQFGPAETEAERAVNREAMLCGMRWLETRLCANNFREMVFQSDNRILRIFATHELGFREARGELTHAIRGAPDTNTFAYSGKANQQP
jgi:hypothetical protein